MTTRSGIPNEKRFGPSLKEHRNELTILLLIVAVIVVSPILTPHFLTGNNLLNLLRQTSYTAIAAIGMFFVILTGGIDLSIGAIMQVVGMTSIIMLINGFSVWTTLLSVFTLGAAVGLINGALVTYGRLQPFIVTLVMQNIMNGTVLVITKAGSISGDVPATFTDIGTGYIGSIPVPVIIMILVCVVTVFVMSKTIFGRQLYVMGSNSVAAFNCGINVNLLRVLAYLICALLATLSGILTVARVGAFQPSTTHGGASGKELDAIAAVVIGGASLTGGKGSVIGTLMGALLYGVLSNLFPLLGINSYVQLLIQGLIIIAAILLSTGLLVSPKHKVKLEVPHEDNL